MYHKRNTHESSQSRGSLDQDTHLQTSAIGIRENSNDDVKSFVIVNDIDLDEELSRAQQSNKNFFQVLSMNFYGKVRSHSFDNVEPKKSEKSPVSSKAEVKPFMSRKGSGNSLLEKKTCASTPIKDEKPKTAILAKKKTSPVRGLDIVTEKFSKALASPKESSRKVSSPKAVAKKSPLLGNLTAKASVKREPLFFFDSSQKSPVSKKKVGDRQNTSPDNKVNSQLNSHLAKKTGLSKLLNGPEIVVENIEEVVQTLSIEPSRIELRPIEFDESEIEKKSVESFVKEKKSSTKESSRRGSDNQVNKEKAGLSSLSARILATPVKLQSKPSQKEAVQKTGAEEKLTKLQLGDIHDLDNETEKKRQGSGSTKNQVVAKGKKNFERSPDTGKHSERTPVVANSGAGYQGMKIILANKESLTPKVAKKGQSKEISTSVLESKRTSFDQNEDQSKSKKTSLGRLDMGNPAVKKVENVGQTRQQPKTPKFDAVKMKGEKSWKVLDAADKNVKEQKRTQPTSPASGETRKVLSFFDKLASLKKREKI